MEEREFKVTVSPMDARFVMLRKYLKSLVADFIDQGHQVSSESFFKNDFNFFLQFSIKHVLHDEGGLGNIDMVKEVQDPIRMMQSKIKYTIDLTVYQYLYQEIDRYIKTYLTKNRAEDVIESFTKNVPQKKRDFPKKFHHDTLLNTLQQLQEQFISLGFISEKTDKKEKELTIFCKNIMDRSFTKLGNAKSVKVLISSLNNANMDYVLEYAQDKYMYPFLFDLIIHSVQIKSIFYGINKKRLYKDMITIDDHLNLLGLPVSSTEYYLSRDFKKFLMLYPLEYMYDEKIDPISIILKHYSEVLKCDYNKVQTVLKQYTLDLADSNRGLYSLSGRHKNQVLGLNKNHFRFFSLDVL
ncbi:MAG: hypothetical protein AB7D43_08110 [Sulfurimonadaceae bacterium]